MRILLVNTNPVVSRLILLNAQEDEGTRVDEIGGDETIPSKRYDIAFIDEQCCGTGKLGDYIRRVQAGKKVLFSTQREHEPEGIDEVVLKPFLPSEISKVLQTIVPISDAEAEAEQLMDPVDGGEEDALLEGNVSDTGEQILDSEEIEKIRRLLVEEYEEEAGTDMQKSEFSEPVPPAEGKNPKKKKKSRKSGKRSGIEHQLLEAITKMKPKKIRKLLGGAEMSIVIRFPEGR